MQNTDKKVWNITPKSVLLFILMALVFWLAARLGDMLGTRSYTFGWILHNKLYWFAAVVSACPAIIWKWKFSLSTFIGVFLGIGCGELFGPNPTGSAVGMGHYGWAIGIGVFLLSIIVGVLLEVFCKKKRRIDN